MKKVRIEINGTLYESCINPKEDIPCFRCAFRSKAMSGCGVQGLCEKHLGSHGYFVKSKSSFDEILQENKDVLHRLKMGMPPKVVISDDSEYNND